MNVIKKKNAVWLCCPPHRRSKTAFKLAKNLQEDGFFGHPCHKHRAADCGFCRPVYDFNIKGNHYRLTTIIRYRYQRVYIKEFFTHAEYGQWNKDRKSSKRK